MNDLEFTLTVRFTRDYAKFKKYARNRCINSRHVMRLCKDMELHGFLDFCPVICDMEMNVWDGQHRLEAAEKAGVPVSYLCIEGLKECDIARHNTLQKTWVLDDFLNANAGNPVYDRLVELRDQSTLPITRLLELIKGRDAMEIRRDFYAGTLVLTAEQTEEVSKVASHLAQFQPYTKHYRLHPFVYAVYHLMQQPNYDPSRMIRKAQKIPTRLVRCASKREYLRVLEEIYNYCEPESRRERFL